jgi:PhnB protein
MKKRKINGGKQLAKKAAAVNVKKVQPIPSGYHNVTPYLSVAGAADAIEFYKKALGAKEIMRMPGPAGKLGHSEIQIGDSRVMLSDEYEEMDFLGPKSRGGTTVHMHVYVKDADAQVEQAVAAGAKVVKPVADQFYGDRSGSIEDPFGHHWHLSTHVKDVPLAELKKKAAQMAKAAQAGQVQAGQLPAV